MTIDVMVNVILWNKYMWVVNIYDCRIINTPDK